MLLSWRKERIPESAWHKLDRCSIYKAQSIYLAWGSKEKQSTAHVKQGSYKIRLPAYWNQKLPTFIFRIEVTKQTDMTGYPSQRMLMLLEVGHGHFIIQPAIFTIHDHQPSTLRLALR